MNVEGIDTLKISSLASLPKLTPFPPALKSMVTKEGLSEATLDIDVKLSLTVNLTSYPYAVSILPLPIITPALLAYVPA